MKSITRSNIHLPIAAMILTAALAAAAAAQQQVPFKGKMQGQDTIIPPNVIDTSGTGTGTLLGEFKFGNETTVNIATVTGSGHWIAANLDSIDTTFTVSAELIPGTTLLRITEFHKITGGTGRFAGAQGSFIMERRHDVVTHVTSGSFYGTITPPGCSSLT